MEKDFEPIVDFWTNVRSKEAAEKWRETRLLRQSSEARGSTTSFEVRGVEETLRDMEGAGIDASVVSGMAGLDPIVPQHNHSIHEVLEWCESHPTRLRAGMTIEGLGSISYICRLIEDLAPNPAFAVVRIISIFLREPINSPRLYPVYERCEALGVPVSINVGVPGPRTRAAMQDPILLDDVLIDFPDLTVIAAHMGHPWEKLLIRLMRKYERLHLANSAWLAKYLDPDIVEFMDSSVGQSRLIFASDAPFISPERALTEAKRVPIGEEAMRAFLGGNAVRALGLLPDGGLERCRS